MTQKAAADLVAGAEDALRERDFERAQAEFEAAIDAAGESTDALDGLARALWWQGDVDGAIRNRERAYAMLRKRGDRAAAARIALWISREYAEAVGNAAAGNGWLARAEGLLRHAGTGPERGWLELTRGSLVADPGEMGRRAEAALEMARASNNPDLEASALALLGRSLLLGGDVDAGVAALDEAMTAITGGEATDPLAFGDVCCVVTLACEESGELGRLMQWNDVVNRYLAQNPHGRLLSFCGTCGAEFFQAMGDLAMVEECLVFAIKGLEGTGHRSRCVHPAARLAELRVMQGRIEEAERLLEGYEDLPESLRGLVAIHRVRGEHAVAAALLLRRVNRMGDTIASAPFLATLVEVQLEAGDVATADRTAGRIAGIAEGTGHPRARAAAALASGRVARARGDQAARAHLEAALEGYVALEMPLEAAHTRVEIALALRDTEVELARREARLAVETFERLGAARDADRAARVLRELGGPARTGPKLLGELSKREVEVLRLLGYGLTNAEIAARLYISTKTVDTHVGNIFAKLHVRNRAEAATFAQGWLPQNSPSR